MPRSAQEDVTVTRKIWLRLTEGKETSHLRTRSEPIPYKMQYFCRSVDQAQLQRTLRLRVSRKLIDSTRQAIIHLAMYAFDTHSHDRRPYEATKCAHYVSCPLSKSLNYDMSPATRIHDESIEALKSNGKHRDIESHGLIRSGQGTPLL